MNSNMNPYIRNMGRKVELRPKMFPVSNMAFHPDYTQRGMGYQLKDLSSIQRPDNRNEEPTTPKNSNEQKGVSMVSSPEVKVYFDNFNNNGNIPKNTPRPLNNFEDIPTASTSTESLLSANNGPGLNKKIVKSQDILIPPLIQYPNMCYPMPPMIANPKPNYHHKRKLSSTEGANLYHSFKRGNQLLSRFDTSKKPPNNYFNKFNTPNEQNENTAILDLNIKVGKNDNRIFKLKKYDDLIDSLKRFCEMNQINQELVRPLSNNIFLSLNKIFWLLNNKIGSYDQSYLLSLYHVWKKNQGKHAKCNDYGCVSKKKKFNSKRNDKDKNNDGDGDQDQGKKSQSFGFYREVEDDDDEFLPQLNNSF